MYRDTSSMARAKARFTSPPAFAGRATASRDQQFFTNHETRDTNHGFYAFHETRNTNHGLYAFLPTISRHFPLFFGPPLPRGRCPRSVCRSRRASWRAPSAGNPGKVYRIPAPAASGLPSAAAKAEGTHAEKGERCILHRQGTFSIALTFWVGQAGWTG